MKKIIAAAAALAIALALAGCGRQKWDSGTPLDISLNNIDIEEVYYRPALHGSVAVDRQTGVMYWISETGAATLLVDEWGKPRKWSAK